MCEDKSTSGDRWAALAALTTTYDADRTHRYWTPAEEFGVLEPMTFPDAERVVAVIGANPGNSSHGDKVSSFLIRSHKSVQAHFGPSAVLYANIGALRGTDGRDFTKADFAESRDLNRAVLTQMLPMVDDIVLAWGDKIARWIPAEIAWTWRLLLAQNPSRLWLAAWTKGGQPTHAGSRWSSTIPQPLVSLAEEWGVSSVAQGMGTVVDRGTVLAKPRWWAGQRDPHH